MIRWLEGGRLCLPGQVGAPAVDAEEVELHGGVTRGEVRGDRGEM